MDEVASVSGVAGHGPVGGTAVWSGQPAETSAAPLEAGATRGRALDFVAPLLLAVATLAALLAYLVPPIPSDHMNYLDAARNFPSLPENDGIIHQQARVGLVIPMAVAVKLFGYSQAAYYVVPVLAAVGLVVGMYVLGTLLFSRAVGVGSAVLAVGNTPMFVDSTGPLPDLLAATLFIWAAVLALAIRNAHPTVSGTPRRRRATLLAIGALLGWSYLAREFIVFLWPLIPIVLFGRVSLRELVWIALPLGAIGLAELALNQYLFGDPLARLHVASEHGSAPVPEQRANTYQNKPRLWYMAQLGATIGRYPEGGWLLGLLAATIAGAIVWPRRLGLLLLWIALLYVPLVLLGGVLNPQAPMLRLILVRYWYPILPILVLGGVAAAWLVSRAVTGRLGLSHRQSGLIAAVLALAVALTPAGIAHASRGGNTVYRANGATQMEQLRAWLAGAGADVATLWTDSRTARVTGLFTRGPFGGVIWDGSIRSLRGSDALSRPQPGDHVLLYSAASPICGYCQVAITQIFGSPARVPAGWMPAFATGDGVLQVYEVR